MKLPSEHIEDLDVKHHGIHLEGMRARSAERAAERALAHNPLLVVSAVAALVTMLFVPPSIAYLDYFSWHTLACLFSILAVIAAIDSSGLLEFVAHSLVQHVTSTRTLVIALVLITLGCSMVLSNDMTLIAVLPLALVLLKSVNRESEIPFAFIAITLTANFGGMLLPFSKPHNLYLYTVFGVSFGDFVAAMAPPLVLSVVLILVCCCFVKKAEFHYRKPESIQVSKPRVAIYVVLFALCIAMTVGAVPFLMGMTVIVVVLAITDRRVFAKTDYALVMTFVCFFIFSGNIAQIPAISDFFSTVLDACGAFVTSLVSSQIISNVPAAILLSGFTDNFRALIIGTNLGGLGTLIASMASLISYRQIANEVPAEKGHYFAMFTISNVVFLAILMGAWALT